MQYINTGSVRNINIHSRSGEEMTDGIYDMNKSTKTKLDRLLLNITVAMKM
jgi:hypothetical protein